MGHRILGYTPSKEGKSTQISAYNVCQGQWVIKAVAKDLPVNNFLTCLMPKLGPKKDLGEDFIERHNRV
jgi:hypothetical protein